MLSDARYGSRGGAEGKQWGCHHNLEKTENFTQASRL